MFPLGFACCSSSWAAWFSTSHRRKAPGRHICLLFVCSSAQCHLVPCLTPLCSGEGGKSSTCPRSAFVTTLCCIWAQSWKPLGKPPHLLVLFPQTVPRGDIGPTVWPGLTPRCSALLRGSASGPDYFVRACFSSKLPK